MVELSPDSDPDGSTNGSEAINRDGQLVLARLETCDSEFSFGISLHRPVNGPSKRDGRAANRKPSRIQDPSTEPCRVLSMKGGRHPEQGGKNTRTPDEGSADANHLGSLHAVASAMGLTRLLKSTQRVSSQSR